MLLLALGLLALVPLVAIRRTDGLRWQPAANCGGAQRLAFLCLVGSAGLFGLAVVLVIGAAAIGIGRELSDPHAFSGAVTPQPSSGIEDLLFWAAKPSVIGSCGCAVVAVPAYGLLAGQAMRRLRRGEQQRSGAE